MSLIEELRDAGALYTGEHFVYTHGKHGRDFVRIDALLTPRNEELFAKVCGRLVDPFRESGIQAVTACDEDRCSRLAGLSAELLGVKSASGNQLNGLDTLIVEDVLTTGIGVRQIARTARSYGARVIGGSVIINRGDVTAEMLELPRLEVLENVPMLAYEPSDCAPCKESLPIVLDIGKGADYRIDNLDYPGGYVRLLTIPQ